MKTALHMLLIVLVSICCCRAGFAQSLDDIKIGHCTAAKTAYVDKPTAINDINEQIKTERKKGLVMDARPFAINQSTGKLLFTEGDGRVSVIHMNPFVYDYKISVAQQELVSTAVSDFLKLLLPPNLAGQVGQQTGKANEAVRTAALKELEGLERRLGKLTLAAPCPAGNNQCEALTEMNTIFGEIKKRVAAGSTLIKNVDDSVIQDIGGVTIRTNARYISFASALTDLRNQQFEAYETCDKAQQLNDTLSSYKFNDFFESLNDAQKEISDITALANDLSSLATTFATDNAINANSPRCGGFDCAAQFKTYATQVIVLIGAAGYQKKLDDLRQKGKEMQNMALFTDQLKDKKGMFARTFTIKKKFELSQATISIKREKLEDKNAANTASKQTGNVDSGGTSGGGSGGGAGSGGGGGAGSGGSSEGTIGNTFGGPVVPSQLQAGAAPTPTSSPAGGSGDKPATATALAADINETIRLGRPRFMLSGGMVYSPLPRRTFKPVKGFVLDAQGNPTGNGDANVIGFDQNSPRRLLPMMFINSRVIDHENSSLFFSLGITAKHDDNVDMEYLVGPSVSFLNDRALFTFGGYGGLTQNLVADVKVGDAIPDSLGDAKFFRKTLTWKPGFSFSYSFSAKKADAKASTGGTSSPSDELKNEIRIGGVPFSLGLGLVVTSLEERTYDEIAGFARDRQGNLTNGQTLTRIVGLTSSSGYRMVPMVMLHTRLTDFGKSRDFYFTSGLTGKKTDNDFDLEYLLGGSVNVYGRKVFLTFGTFIGKQQILGGNFFEGAALNKTQNVTTINRYVWKPAVSVSYDISRIIPRSN